jgi:hypothetical protein
VKIPRRPKHFIPADTTIWEQLAEHINKPGDWEHSGQHSHDGTDPGHSHGSHSQSIPDEYGYESGS